MEMILIFLLNMSLIGTLSSIESHKKNSTSDLVRSEQDLHSMLFKVGKFLQIAFFVSLLARSRRNCATSVEVTDRYVLLKGRGRRRRNRDKIILRNNNDDPNHNHCCCHDHWHYNHGARRRRKPVRIPRIFHKQDVFVDVNQPEASDLNQQNSLNKFYEYNDKKGFWSKSLAKRKILQNRQLNG